MTGGTITEQRTPSLNTKQSTVGGYIIPPLTDNKTIIKTLNKFSQNLNKKKEHYLEYRQTSINLDLFQGKRSCVTRLAYSLSKNKLPLCANYCLIND